ncbi:MAG: ribbon-helix-helix protein, CopG family [Alphaproteobacteria bacterium]|nr:ribbon-helix-helix protein, CopG family [Alphaproteobacteria bacterium]
MTTEPRSRKRGRPYAGRPTTVTIYLSASEEEALSERAKAENQSVPAFVAGAVRARLQNEKAREQ